MHICFLDDDTPISLDALNAAGVYARTLGRDPAVYQPALDDLLSTRGYVTKDEVKLSPTTPNLDAICEKFRGEHHHDDDEVRFVIDGAGIFDIRDTNDRFMRVVVEPGDLIVVPKGRHHRFFLTDARAIHCVRLFKDESGWTPVYRTDAPTAP